MTVLTAVVLAFTTPPQAVETADPAPAGVRRDKQRQPFPPPPPVPSLRECRFPGAAVKRIGTAGDARLGSAGFCMLLRFAGRDTSGDVVSAFKKLTSAPLADEPFTAMGDCRRHRASANSSVICSC